MKGMKINMTIFGIIWIMLLILSLFVNIKMMFALTIISSVLQCDNVLIIGENGVGPQIVASIFFIIKVLLLYRKNRQESFNQNTKNFRLLMLFLLGLLAIIVFSTIYNNAFQYSSLRVVQFGIYVICFYCMNRIGIKLDAKFIYTFIRTLTIFLLIIGFIQLLITTNIIPRFNIMTVLFYNDSLHSATVYYTRNNYFRILSTFMEPSYYACYLIGAFYYFLSFKNLYKKNMWLLVIIFIQIILTFSSTAYGTFAILWIIFILQNKSLNKKFLLILLSVLGILFAYIFFYNILDQVIFSKDTSGSAVARRSFDNRALRAFETSKIIGVGYKTTRASSIIYNILAELGILGLINYLLVLLYVIKNIFNKNTKNMLLLAIYMALIGSMIAQIIAVPDLDNCSFWMWLNLLAVTYSCKHNEIEAGDLNE